MPYRYSHKLAICLGFSVLLVSISSNAYTAGPIKKLDKSSVRQPQPYELAEALRLYAAEDYRGAYPIAASLAEKGNPAAMYLLSELFAVYDSTQHLSADWKRSFDWLQRAADKSHPPAMTKLGSVLLDDSLVKNYGTSPDINRGLKLIFEAEKLGDNEAMDRIGNIYAAGTGVPVDLKEAFRWYEKYEKATGKKSINKGFIIEQEMNSRIGREVCQSDLGNKMPKRRVLLNSGKNIDLVVAGTIVARSDSYDKVAVRINSITATDERGSTTHLQSFQFPGSTLTVGQESWDHTLGLVSCF